MDDPLFALNSPRDKEKSSIAKCCTVFLKYLGVDDQIKTSKLIFESKKYNFRGGAGTLSNQD